MEFKEYQLGDIVDIRSSKRIYHKDYVNQGIPFYRSKEIIQKSKGERIDNPLFIKKEYFEQIKEKYGAPQPGEILLTSVGTIGVSYMVQENDEFYFKDGNLTWFSNFSDVLLNDYLLYWLKSPLGKKEIDNIVIGSTQKALTMVQLKKMTINIPTRDTQRKVVNILKSLDYKMNQNRDIIITLEKTAATLFQHWFVDFDFPDEKGNPYKSSGGKIIKSESGEIPSSWRIASLSEVGDIIAGGTPSKKIDSYYEGETIPWITPKDLSNNKNTFVSKGATDITKLGLDKSSAKLLPEYSVLFSSRAPIGYVAINKNPVSTNQGFKSVVPNENIPYQFIYFYLKNNTGYIESIAGGSTFKEISGKAMKELSIILPTQDLLDQFRVTTQPFFDGIKNLEESNDTITKLRDTLLPKLLSGEIELPVEEEVRV